MKIHENKPIIRVDISKTGEKRRALSLEDCDLDETTKFLQEIIIKNASSLPQGKRTSIVIREYYGKLGKSKTISCYGLNPETIIELIKEELSHQ